MLGRRQPERHGGEERRRRLLALPVERGGVADFGDAGADRVEHFERRHHLARGVHGDLEAPAGNASMRSATRSADMPGPGRRFGQDVTMRQRRVCARATAGAARAPLLRRAKTVRRLMFVMCRSLLRLARRRSPPRVKMMHRAVARADLEAVGRRDRGGDVGLRRAHGFGQARPLARPAAIADDSVQPVPWVFWVATRGAARRGTPCGLDQEVDASGAAAVAALDQHRAGAEREQALGLRAHRGFVGGDRRVEQRRGLRQVRRDQERARDQQRRSASTAARIEQPVARGRDHDGIEHHVVCAVPVEPGATASMVAACDSMPIFTAPTARSENTASICAAMKSGGTSWMPATPKVFCAVSAVITEAP